MKCNLICNSREENRLQFHMQHALLGLKFMEIFELENFVLNKGCFFNLDRTLNCKK